MAANTAQSLQAIYESAATVGHLEGLLAVYMAAWNSAKSQNASGDAGTVFASLTQPTTAQIPVISAPRLR